MRTLVRTVRRPEDSAAMSGVNSMMRHGPALYPFTLNFKGNCACFSFIFEGKPVALTGNNPAPSCLVSHREAGDMVFRLPGKNRNAFFRAQGIPPEKVYGLFQVHSHNVYTLGEPGHDPAFSALLPPPEVFAQKGDGIVSFAPSAFLAVTAADCLPVFLLDTENGFFAALHSGWKGTGIVVKALEIMKTRGSRPEAIAAVLGPCIQSCCYKVDEERAKHFKAEFGEDFLNKKPAEYPLGGVVRQKKSGWFINLPAANARLLAAGGVRHIAHCTDCTFTDTRLGSFRREGAEAFTRMIAIAGPKPLL